MSQHLDPFTSVSYAAGLITGILGSRGDGEVGGGSVLFLWLASFLLIAYKRSRSNNA